METMESNGLIAEFMGHEILYRPYSNGFIELSDTQLCDVDDLLYHKSWDWLMPVVEKINNTCSDKYGNHYDFQIGNGYVWVDPHIGDRIFFSDNDINHEDEPMRNKVYRGVVKFIEWYNK